MSDPFLGQIQAYAFNFAPRGWSQCDGQLLPVSQYSALFSLLGTIYGGDGRTTFSLPDLRGRFPMHEGTGGGLTSRFMGQRSGSETHTLTTNELPSHRHSLSVTAEDGNQASPINANPATANDGESNYSTDRGSLSTNTNFTNLTGQNQAHNNLPPFLVVNFSIATTGIFPSRS